MKTFIFVVILSGITLSAGLAASQDTTCVIDKYGQYAATQEKWQHDLTNLVLSAYPRFTEVANQYLEDQLTRIELRRLAVAFMARQAPDKLNLAAPLNQWLDLDPSTEAAIAKTNKRYADLLRSRKQARERPPHPDGDALRKVMREHVVKMPAYRALAGKFAASIAQIENVTCE